MFKPQKSGFTFVGGNLVRYKKGEVSVYDLSHISHAKMVNTSHKTVVSNTETRSPDNPEKEIVYPKKYKPVQGTVKEIKDWLDENGIAYDPRARKAQLLDLLRKV